MRLTARPFIRFITGIPLICGFFLVLVLLLKTVFVISNWSSFRMIGYGAMAHSLYKGLRFDFAVIAYLSGPAIIFYHLAALTNRRGFRWLLISYLSSISMIILFLWLADIQYFQEAGKHFTYEAFVYLNTSIVPVISGAFRLHPWISSLSLFSCLALGVGTALLFQRLLAYCLVPWPIKPLVILFYTIHLGILTGLGIIAARGGVQLYPVNISYALISPNPYLNALCLNPVYSVLYTIFHSAKQIQFFDEVSNLQAVKKTLHIEADTSAGGGGAPLGAPARYPLLRRSAGLDQGNRRNIVMIILESWSAKDMGCLGGDTGFTPSFDQLSAQGLLFTNFYATGIRTSEGVFSILCSFPNQPLQPIMHLPVVQQIHWRPISQILAEAGYKNVFIHGRELDFDGIHEFLHYIHFHTIIDRNDFPPTAIPARDSWPGYHDEDVMRRADEEFARNSDQPFFGIIYTMNTHPPFVTPDGFPQVVPPTSIQNKYLNSLRYSDHTLQIFFSLAREKSYFNNTIFILVADHTRTKDNFNLSNQHHIPLLIYAPGMIDPGINPGMGSQVDLLPTILGLLNLRTWHSSWGQDLLNMNPDDGFAVSVVGNDVRWHDRAYLLNDGLAKSPPLLFDVLRDPDCTTDIWPQQTQTGIELQNKLRAYVSLSQTLLYQNRVYP
jgi:phosphoglycerol transferase MdoB-like AlkP superfamily enzyme